MTATNIDPMPDPSTAGKVDDETPMFIVTEFGAKNAPTHRGPALIDPGMARRIVADGMRANRLRLATTDPDSPAWDNVAVEIVRQLSYLAVLESERTSA